MVNKKLAAIMIILLILCTITALAAPKESKNVAQSNKNFDTRAQKEISLDISPDDLVAGTPERDFHFRLPDLVIKSARVTGPASNEPPEWYYDRGESWMLWIPLEITVANNGIGTSGDFNVGAMLLATDGGYGYSDEYLVDGETIMEGREGVICHGLASRAEKTYQGYLKVDHIRGAWTDAWMYDLGNSFTIDVMVDYNLDPDSAYYDWGIPESNEDNNKLTIRYSR